MTRVVSAIILITDLAFVGFRACTAARTAADLKSEAAKADMAVERKHGRGIGQKEMRPSSRPHTRRMATLYMPGADAPAHGHQIPARGREAGLRRSGVSIAMTRAKTPGLYRAISATRKAASRVRYTDPKTKGAAGYSGYLSDAVHQANSPTAAGRSIEDMATPAS